MMSPTSRESHGIPSVSTLHFRVGPRGGAVGVDRSRRPDRRWARATRPSRRHPDFSQDASRVTILSAQSGSWSSASTWQGGQIPTGNHVVRILLGHTVTIDDTAAVAYTVAIDGKLAFAPTVNTRLKVTNLEVMAGNMAMGTPGVLEVGTAATPIAANVTAEIVIANSPLGGSVADPDQFGTGIIVFGKMTMHGSVRTPTFVRLAAEPRAGHTTLTLSEAVSGWKVGDRLVLPGHPAHQGKRSHRRPAGSTPSTSGKSARSRPCRRTAKPLTLTSRLQYDHLGARDLNGVLDFPAARRQPDPERHRPLGESRRDPRAHARQPHGRRGHPLCALQGPRTHDVSAAETTRRNHIGRYPLHMHHISGPLPTPANGYQFTLVGNAVDGGSVETKFKWGIAVHGSHYGLIQDNVVYNYNGASIATEDGSESFNVFDHNFALRGMGEPNNSVSEARMAMGTEGVGFWFRGPEQLRPQQRRGQFPESDDRSRVWVRLPVPLPGQYRDPEFQGRRHHGHMAPASRRPGTATTCRSSNSRTTKRTARCRADSRTGGSAPRIRSPTRTGRKA